MVTVTPIGSLGVELRRCGASNAAAHLNARLAPLPPSTLVRRTTHVKNYQTVKCNALPEFAASAADFHVGLAHLEHTLQVADHGNPLTNPELLSHMLSIADAAVATASDATSQAATTGKDNGWLTPLVDTLEYVLRYIQTNLDKLNVPYSYGWSIVALTAFVKLLAFPLTKTQVESSMSMQALKPTIDAIKEKYGEDREAIQRETNALYEKAGVNPLAGCLPSLATIPIFIGLYRSLSSVSQQGELDGQGFYWIPSLAGPTSVAAQKAGSGSAWLFPFVDGAPPIGWELAGRYVALPIALVIAQYISSAIITPPVDPNAENAKVTKGLLLFLPLMVGWFALNVPSGLSLYYFSNTVLTSAQQIYLRKLGGSDAGEFDLGPIELGKARRTGEVATSDEEAEIAVAEAANMAYTNGSSSNGVAVEEDVALSASGALAVEEVPIVPMINRRCKRKRRELLQQQA